MLNALQQLRSPLLNAGENGVYVEDMQHKHTPNNTLKAQPPEKEEADMEMIDTY